MLSGGNSIWARVDLSYGEVGKWWWLVLGWQWAWQWGDLVWTGSLSVRVAVRDGGCEPSLSQLRWSRHLMWMKVKMWLLSGDNKNKNYFFIICNAKMYLVRNFASRTKMKSHDMNRDGMLDGYATWFGGSAESFIGSRDLVNNRLPIR
jgi:hypothetical protein